MSKYPLTQVEFKTIYSKVPRLTVELIIQTPKGIILTKRSMEPYVGYWHIPGGTVYMKETLEDAIARVAKNGLDVEVVIKKHLGFIYYPTLNKEYGWDWPVGTAFLVEIKEGEPKGSDQGEEIGFFNEVPEKTVPDQIEFLKKQSASVH